MRIGDLARRRPAAARAAERIVFGGERRGRFVARLLRLHADSLFRREWAWSDEQPHFYDHRLDAWGLADGAVAPWVFFRGYFTAQLIRPGDRVLDIGCGDGFFTARFLAPRAAHVDGIDIEPDAIAFAARTHPAPNVRYSLRDAVADAFPANRYDVIAWDGALGHFDPATTDTMFGKIVGALGPDGVCCGSESLGAEGHDHLQFFDTLDDMRAVLAPHFDVVDLCEVAYPIGGGALRREGFWRAARQPERLDAAGWARIGSGREVDFS